MHLLPTIPYEQVSQFDSGRPCKKRIEGKQMELNCLTPEFPQGARVYDANGVAPSLLNSASAMRSQGFLVCGGGARMEDDSVMCMAGNMVDRNTDQNGSGVRADASFTLNTVDRHAVAYDARNHRVNGEVSGTLQAKGEGGWSLNYINPVLQSTDGKMAAFREQSYDNYVEDGVAGTIKKSGGALGAGSETTVCEKNQTPDWVVRRLIPLECGRLQGFPDGWAEIAPLTSLDEIPFWREVYARDCEIKGKRPSQKIMRADSRESDWALMRWHDELHSMAAEYAMWGNGMALPNALFFVKSAFRELEKHPREIKLGSLFDGSGTMPLCAAMCGGRPVWASEIEPYPIAVTKTHLPSMKHLGSVTEIKGSRIEPVDIITFGSPCQDLSIAGKRAGLDGARSGLFREAIRIIREMLNATGGKYPRFVIWENVPGALSSNGGKDFEVVLNELLHLREFAGGGADKPILQHGKWGGFANYGAVAYRIVNAQYWGVPQRRRRVYAVCDTRGQSAGMVTFERKGTQWNFDPRIPQGKEVAGLTADCYSWHDRMVASKPSGGQHEAYTMKIRSGCEGGGKGALVQKELSATLATHQDQTVFEKTENPCYPINTMLATRDKALGRRTGLGIGNAGDPQFTITKGHEHAVAYSFDSLASNSMKSANPNSGCHETNTGRTLDCGYPDPSKNQGGIAIVQKNPVTFDKTGGIERDAESDSD